jgi:glucokinase
MAKYVIGFDLGGTKMAAALMTPKFEVKARSRQRSKAHESGDDIYGRIVNTIRDAVGEAKIDPKKELVGIGVGSPGPLDPETGTIIDCANLNWSDFPLGKKLEKEFGCPVVVDNDVNVGTYGEFHFGAGRGSKHLVGIFPGTGIGGGLVLDGRIYHGASGSAGEVGHMTLDPDGPNCGCGKPGCYEAYAGRNVIAAAAATVALRGQAPTLLKNKGSDVRTIRSGALKRSVAGGDKEVETVVRRAAYQIGILGANLINVLSPDTLVLGGGLVEAMPDLFRDEVKRALKTHAMPFLRKFCTLKIAELGDDATIMGAAKLVVEKIEA